MYKYVNENQKQCLHVHITIQDFNSRQKLIMKINWIRMILDYAMSNCEIIRVWFLCICIKISKNLCKNIKNYIFYAILKILYYIIISV